MSSTDIVILAAGHGKRMQSELPKPLVPLKGKALIHHVLETVEASGLCNAPVIIIGQKREHMIEALGKDRRYVVQEEQLGTGHAVQCTESVIHPDAHSVLVLYADQPFITASTIKNLVELRSDTGAKIVMATVQLPDFNEWRSAFLGFSRVLRDEKGEIVGVIENKDATEEEKKITEVNPAYFCFEKEWLFKTLPKIKNENAQGEYYLTDLVKMAFAEGLRIPSISISPKEAIGTNSKEDLESVEEVF